MRMQLASSSSATAVTCTSDGAIYVGDSSGSIWVIGNATGGMAGHGLAAKCPSGAVQTIVAEAHGLVAATSDGVVYKFSVQDGEWQQQHEACCLACHRNHYCFKCSWPV